MTKTTKTEVDVIRNAKYYVIQDLYLEMDNLAAGPDLPADVREEMYRLARLLALPDNDFNTLVELYKADYFHVWDDGYWIAASVPDKLRDSICQKVTHQSTIQ